MGSLATPHNLLFCSCLLKGLWERKLDVMEGMIETMVFFGQRQTSLYLVAKVVLPLAYAARLDTIQPDGVKDTPLRGAEM